MSLSKELVSKFVKTTNDDVKTKNESIVYGTICVDETSNDMSTKYVKIDGSDTLIPVTTNQNTTTKIEDGDRVTVMIKDHSALITGNLTAPATTDNSVNASFENLITGYAKIGDLEVTNGRVDDLAAIDVTVQNTLDAHDGRIVTLESNKITTDDFNAERAKIAELQTSTAEISKLVATKATISDLESATAEITALESDIADINTLVAKKADISDLESATAEINTLKANKANITDLNAAVGRIDDLESATAEITNLESDIADINTLIFGSAAGDTIQTSFANAVIAQLGDAAIKSAMIDSVSASKITSGEIITNDITVKSNNGKLIVSDETIQISDDDRVRVQIGKDASNDYSINIWDQNGNLMFSKGGITDSAIKEAIIRNDMISESANISASKLDISSLFDKINEDGSKTIKASKVKLEDKNQTLEVAFKTLSGDVSSQGTSISAIQGQISSKIWQQDIVTATQGLLTNYSALQQTVDSISSTVLSHDYSINKKADKSAVSTLEQSLNGFKTSVSETYATKSDLNDIDINIESNINEISTKYTTLEQSLDGFKATVVDVYATKSYLNDVESNVNELSTQCSTLEQSLEGFRLTIENDVYGSGGTKEETVEVPFSEGTEIKPGDTIIVNISPEVEFYDELEYRGSNGEFIYVNFGNDGWSFCYGWNSDADVGFNAGSESQCFTLPTNATDNPADSVGTHTYVYNGAPCSITGVLNSNDHITMSVRTTKLVPADGLIGRLASAENKIEIIQGQISSEIWQQDIDAAKGEMSTKYTTLEQNLNSFKTTVSGTYATKSALSSANSSITQLSNRISTNVTEIDGLKSRASTIEQTASDLSVRLTDAGKTATDFLNFSDDGLVVGNLNASQGMKEETVDIPFAVGIEIKPGDTIVITIKDTAGSEEYMDFYASGVFMHIRILCLVVPVVTVGICMVFHGQLVNQNNVLRLIMNTHTKTLVHTRIYMMGSHAQYQA